MRERERETRRWGRSSSSDFCIFMKENCSIWWGWREVEMVDQACDECRKPNYYGLMGSESFCRACRFHCREWGDLWKVLLLLSVVFQLPWSYAVCVGWERLVSWHWWNCHGGEQVKGSSSIRFVFRLWALPLR
jgi:hypothetical protein